MALTSLRKQLPLALEASAKESAIIIDASIQKNFQSGGRPSWSKTKRGGKILLKTGRLRAAIAVKGEKVSDRRYRVVARVNKIKYAKIHNFGGVIKPKSA